MKPQKPNRRECREAALQVLFCQSFAGQDPTAAASAVEATRTIEAFQGTIASLAETQRATDQTIAALRGVIAALTEAAQQPGSPKRVKKVKENPLTTRVYLGEARKKALGALKDATEVLKHSESLFEEKSFTMRLLEIYEHNRGRIEDTLGRSLEGWSLRRLTAEDGAMLRLGVTELLYMEDVPPKVVINEYLELAKQYGEDDSSKLLNGVLDRVLRDNPRPDEKA
ncbi:hypothetical protein BH09SUM1_BH09SUM1_21500 [soil metagenome]